MTADEIEACVHELYNRRPGADLARFERMDAGGPNRPWSVNDGPYRSYYPSRQILREASHEAQVGDSGRVRRRFRLGQRKSLPTHGRR